LDWRLWISVASEGGLSRIPRAARTSSIRLKCAQPESLSEQRSNRIGPGLPSGSSDGGQIKGGARIENKSPFRVAATFALKRSIFESPHGGLIVWFDQFKPHLVAANEALHRRFSRLQAKGSRASSARNDRGRQKFLCALGGGRAGLLGRPGCGLPGCPIPEEASTYVRTTTYESEMEPKRGSRVADLWR
jgi:hypothetical protein